MKLLALLLLCSCSLFKSQNTLDLKDTEKLINSVQVTGEGKGRLTLGQNQYLFSVDSVLNETNDWILAVTIPLHGEEVMILKDMKKVRVDDDESESFEKRISAEINRLNLGQKISGEQFIREMRSLIRFHLSSKLGLKRNCSMQQSDLICELGIEKFRVNLKKDVLHVENISYEGSGLKLIAANLTGPIFTKTTITLSSEKPHSPSSKSALQLELFW